MGLGHSPAVVSEGLVFYFDPINTRSYAGTGLTGFNLIDTSIVGSFVGGAVYDVANKGSVYFDGVDDRISFSFNSALDISQSITIEAYIKPQSYPTAGGGGMIVTKVASYYLEFGSNGKIRVYFEGLNSPGYHESVSTVPLNKWTHVSATRNSSSSTINIYINGILDKTVSGITGNIIVQQTWYLTMGGYNGGGYLYIGLIGYGKIYNRALSSTEILQNYNATKKRFSPEENILTNGLVLYLDAGNSSSYAGTGITAYSISGIGYTGTLVNGSAFSLSNGGAFVLDGTNDFISAPIDASLFSTEATMIVWLKNLNATPAAAANSGFLGYGQGQVNDHYPYVNGVAYLSTFRNIRIEGIPLSSTINRAMPHMVTVTTNSTNWRLYQNATLQYTDTSVGTVYLSRYTIGYSIDNFFYQGNVYAFMIYNRALTANEILQNYNALKGRYGLS